jgi:hypothetical protein
VNSHNIEKTMYIPPVPNNYLGRRLTIREIPALKSLAGFKYKRRLMLKGSVSKWKDC